MKSLLFLGVLLAPAVAHGEGGALSGPTGLLAVPTAEILGEGDIRLGASEHDSVPAHDGVVNYLATVGFAPGLELGGRVVQTGTFNGDTNDLSLNAKLRIWQFDN